MATISQPPLTTIFTPSTICTEPYLTFDNRANIHVWGSSRGVTTIEKFQWETQYGCYPSGFFTSDRLYTFSPGVCPSGYTTASLSVNSLQQKTIARCCPSNAPYVTATGTRGDNWCHSPPASPATIVVNGASTFGHYAIVQQAIGVQWQSSDLASFTPASAPILSTSQATQQATRTPSSSPTSTSTTSPSQTTTSSSSGLTTADKAGIAVGVILGAIILALTVLFFWMRRRRRLRKARGDPTQSQPYTALAMYSGGDGSENYQKAELEDQGRTRHGSGAQELDAERSPAEKYGNQITPSVVPPQELSAEPRSA